MLATGAGDGNYKGSTAQPDLHVAVPTPPHPCLMLQSSGALTPASVLQVELLLPPSSAKEKEGSVLSGRRVSAHPQRSSQPLIDFEEESGDRRDFFSQASWPGCQKDLGFAEGLARRPHFQVPSACWKRL